MLPAQRGTDPVKTWREVLMRRGSLSSVTAALRGALRAGLPPQGWWARACAVEVLRALSELLYTPARLEAAVRAGASSLERKAGLRTQADGQISEARFRALDEGPCDEGDHVPRVNAALVRLCVIALVSLCHGRAGDQRAGHMPLAPKAVQSHRTPRRWRAGPCAVVVGSLGVPPAAAHVEFQINLASIEAGPRSGPSAVPRSGNALRFPE
jgi:hypothetical protein